MPAAERPRRRARCGGPAKGAPAWVASEGGRCRWGGGLGGRARSSPPPQSRCKKQKDRKGSEARGGGRNQTRAGPPSAERPGGAREGGPGSTVRRPCPRARGARPARRHAGLPGVPGCGGDAPVAARGRIVGAAARTPLPSGRPRTARGEQRGASTAGADSRGYVTMPLGSAGGGWKGGSCGPAQSRGAPAARAPGQGGPRRRMEEADGRRAPSAAERGQTLRRGPRETQMQNVEAASPCRCRRAAAQAGHALQQTRQASPRRSGARRWAPATPPRRS
jgi:translation initiation factor IF-2